MYSRVRFNHSNYYYEAIAVIVSKSDFYILTSNSSIDLYGHLYKDRFDPFNPTNNLIAWYGKCCNKSQFKFTFELLINTKYILVVTTYNQHVTGSFSITVFGSNAVRLERISNIHSSRRPLTIFFVK